MREVTIFHYHLNIGDDEMIYRIFKGNNGYKIKASMDGDIWYTWKHDLLYKCIEEIKHLTGDRKILLERKSRHSHTTENIEVFYDR